VGDSAVASAPRIIGRYAIYDDIASGGMATVHLGRLIGPVGFSRTVAIKRLHPQFAKDPEFVSMFLDEARLAARVQHPNVVATIDVVATDGELFLIMDYVRGESLSKLLRTARKAGQRIPPRIAASIMCGFLHGLHAAHEAKATASISFIATCHRKTFSSAPTAFRVCSTSASRRRPDASRSRETVRSRASSRTCRRSSSPAVT